MTTAVPGRSRTSLIVDRVAGILIALVALGIAIALYTAFFAFRAPAGPLATNCAASGAVCDQGFLNTICYIGYALCIFGWLVPTVLMLVRFIQRRLAWFLPLISIGVLLIGFYVLLFVLGRNYGV
jgi:hypothetical protein